MLEPTELEMLIWINGMLVLFITTIASIIIIVLSFMMRDFYDRQMELIRSIYNNQISDENKNIKME